MVNVEGHANSHVEHERPLLIGFLEKGVTVCNATVSCQKLSCTQYKTTQLHEMKIYSNHLFHRSHETRKIETMNLFCPLDRQLKYKMQGDNIDRDIVTKRDKKRQALSYFLGCLACHLSACDLIMCWLHPNLHPHIWVSSTSVVSNSYSLRLQLTDPNLWPLQRYSNWFAVFEILYIFWQLFFLTNGLMTHNL